jgi:hypothetical protein
MAESTLFFPGRGDTVLGTIRSTFGRLPQVELDRMLEEFERINKRPPGDIKAGLAYVLPGTTYHRDQVGERFGADELLNVISAGAAYRNKSLGRVNSWRELTGLGPATFTPSTLASSVRAHSTATDKDIQDRVIAQALAEGFAKIEQLEPWFTRRGYDKVFLKDTAAAVRAQLGEKRQARTAEKADLLFPYELEKTIGEYKYRQGDTERRQVVDDAISNLKSGFTAKPGSDVKEYDSTKAYSQMIARLIALGADTTDLNSARATFKAMNDLRTAEANGTMDENLARIARDIVSRVDSGDLKPTEALSEFNDRTVSYTDEQKKDARTTINNFITVARQQVQDERALETDIYTRDKRVLELNKARREDRLPALTKATENFVLAVLGEVTDAVLAGKLEYGDAADVLSDRLRSDSRGRGVYPDPKTIGEAQTMLLREIESKKPETPAAERAWVQDINILTSLADITGKDGDQIEKDLSSLNSRIRSKIRETWMAEKARGYAVRKEAEATGVRYARALRTILRGVPEAQRQVTWDYLKGTMSPPELLGWDKFESEIGANLWESRAPLPTNVKEPTPEPGSIEAIAPERSAADARAFELQIITNEDGSRRYTNDEIKRILIGEGLTDEKGKRLK